MKIDSPAEACAALAAIIVAADELGTTEERKFLFETVRALPIFQGLDHGQFKKLMSDTTEELYASFPMDGARVSSDGVGRLVDMIRDALPAERRAEALEAAVGLARSDGVTSVEALLLQRLCEGLDLDAAAASRLLGRIA
ncbi:MAG: TerB family tellurite resistance protein [Gemmatimonadales bacterium]